MRKALASLLAIQAGITLAVAAGFYVYQGPGGVWAALYGGGIALGVSGLLGFRLVRASRPGVGAAGAVGLYLGAVERFVFVGAAFALGIAALKLAPVPMLAGFGAAEMGYFFAAGALRGEQSEAGRKDGD